MTSRSGERPHSWLTATYRYGRIHAKKLGYLAHRAVGHPALELADAAVERCVLSPAETLPHLPPRMPKTALDNIRLNWKGEPASEVITTITQRTWHHAATEVFTLHNVALVGSRIYGHRFVHDLNRGAKPRLHEIEEFDEVTLVSTWAGTQWFGHFIHDELPLQLLAQSFPKPITQGRKPYRDESAYRGVFGIPAPHASPAFFARRCNIFIDHAQNSSKRERYAKMRKAVPRSNQPRLRIYLQRVDGFARIMHEETDLLQRLVRRGFIVLRNDQHSVAEIVEKCSRASQIVTIDGSHAAPTLFLAPEEAEICVICPPDRVTCILNDIAESAGLRSALYIGRSADENGYSVDTDELLGFIDDFEA